MKKPQIGIEKEGTARLTLEDYCYNGHHFVRAFSIGDEGRRVDEVLTVDGQPIEDSGAWRTQVNEAREADRKKGA